MPGRLALRMAWERPQEFHIVHVSCGTHALFLIDTCCIVEKELHCLTHALVRTLS